MTVKRGDIYYADLSPVVGSEQGGIRPVLIVQNDVGNRFSPTVIAAAITSQKYKTNLPTHIRVNADGCGLAKDSIVLLEQCARSTKSVLRKKWARSAVRIWAGWIRLFPSASESEKRTSNIETDIGRERASLPARFLCEPNKLISLYMVRRPR